MARRRYRRYKKKDDTLSGVGVLVGIALLGAWQTQQYTSELILYGAIAVTILVGIVGIFVTRKYIQTRRRLHALQIADVDTMDPLKFEEYVAMLLRYQGFHNIRLTTKFDYGVDVIAEKDGVRWGVQVKRYSGQVKADAVRQVVTALIRYSCTRSMVVTNSTFSRPARVLAADNQCVLLDRDILAEWIATFQAKTVK